MDMPLDRPWNKSEFNNVAAALSRQAEQQPYAIAIHYPEGGPFKRVKYTSCTYLELDELSDC